MEDNTIDQIDLNTDAGREKLTLLFRYAQIGRCVNSVTHDVNNYLGAIMAYAELIGLDAQLPDDSQRMIGEIVSAVRKSSDLINNLTDDTENKLRYLRGLIRDLEDRLNQEERDRTSADTSLEDRIADLENA